MCHGMLVPLSAATLEDTLAAHTETLAQYPRASSATRSDGTIGESYATVVRQMMYEYGVCSKFRVAVVLKVDSVKCFLDFSVGTVAKFYPTRYWSHCNDWCALSQLFDEPCGLIHATVHFIVDMMQPLCHWEVS